MAGDHCIGEHSLDPVPRRALPSLGQMPASHWSSCDSAWFQGSQGLAPLSTLSDLSPYAQFSSLPGIFLGISGWPALSFAPALAFRSPSSIGLELAHPYLAVSPSPRALAPVWFRHPALSGRGSWVMLCSLVYKKKKKPNWSRQSWGASSDEPFPIVVLGEGLCRVHAPTRHHQDCTHPSPWVASAFHLEKRFGLLFPCLPWSLRCVYPDLWFSFFIQPPGWCGVCGGCAQS